MPVGAEAKKAAMKLSLAFGIPHTPDKGDHCDACEMAKVILIHAGRGWAQGLVVVSGDEILDHPFPKNVTHAAAMLSDFTSSGQRDAFAALMHEAAVEMWNALQDMQDQRNINVH